MTLLVAGIAGVGLSSCAGDVSDGPAAGSGAARPITDSAVRTSLSSAARTLAQRAGVEAPASMVAVAATDHQAAELVVSGALLADRRPVYVVQMTGGTFTASHHRYGQPAPQGTVLTVTFDAATMEVTDVGYDTIAPDLTKIDATPVDLLGSASP